MSTRSDAVAYRDFMAALASMIDSFPEDQIPRTEFRSFHDFKREFETAFGEVDRMAAFEGVTPPQAGPLPDGVESLYDHLAANLRWPPGYGREHKLDTIHAMLGKPTTAALARERAAEWYAANNEGDADAA